MAFALAATGTRHLSDLAGRFTLVFTGVAAGHTPIQPFLDTLGRVLAERSDLAAGIAVVLVGGQPQEVQSAVAAFSRRFPEVIGVHPAVTPSRAVEIMREAGALLLLLTTAYEGIVPQKTYDYLMAGGPILAFGNTSEAGALIEATGSGVVVPTDDPAALAGALDLLRTQGRERWRTPAREALAGPLDRRATSAGLLSFALGIARG
jgi:hypothetical protein